MAENEIVEDKLTKVPNLYYTIMVKNFDTLEEDVVKLVAKHKQSIEYNCVFYIRILRVGDV